MLQRIRVLLFLYLLPAGTCAIHAQVQRQSTLFPLFSSNSMIDRPELFRKLQDNIGNEVADVKPGLQVDLLDAKLAQLREILSTMMNQVNVSYRAAVPGSPATPAALTLQFPVTGGIETLSVNLPNLSPADLQATCHDLIDTKLKPKLEAVLKQALGTLEKDETPNALAKEVNNILTVAGQGLSEFTEGNTQADLAKKIATAVCELIKKGVDPIVKRLGESLNDAAIKAAINSLNEVLHSFLSKVADGLNSAEHYIDDALRRFSGVLLSANIGMAVKEGEGDFSGGTHVSFTFPGIDMGSTGRLSLQLGTYFNTHFAEQDSTVPAAEREGRWLIGGQLRAALGNWQAEVLYAFHANTAGKLHLPSGQQEFGLGASHLIETWKTTFGLGYTASVIGAEENASKGRRTLGAWVRRGDPNSPTLLIGWTWEHQRIAPGDDASNLTRNYPMAQLIYPITPY